jgi:hypothetical protein
MNELTLSTRIRRGSEVRGCWLASQEEVRPAPIFTLGQPCGDDTFQPCTPPPRATFRRPSGLLWRRNPTRVRPGTARRGCIKLPFGFWVAQLARIPKTPTEMVTRWTTDLSRGDEETHDERTKRASRIPCSGNAESRERQTRRYLVGLHAARRVRRGARRLRADLANSHFHNPDAHDRSLLPISTIGSPRASTQPT